MYPLQSYGRVTPSPDPQGLFSRLLTLLLIRLKTSSTQMVAVSIGWMRTNWGLLRSEWTLSKQEAVEAANTLISPLTRHLDSQLRLILMRTKRRVTRTLSMPSTLISRATQARQTRTRPTSGRVRKGWRSVTHRSTRQEPSLMLRSLRASLGILSWLTTRGLLILILYTLWTRI